MPAGAYKGSGLGIISEVLAAALPAARLSIEISRSGPIDGGPRDPRNVGHIFLAVDIAALQPLDVFLDRVDALIDVIKTTTPAPGYDEVLLPGEIEQRHHDRAVRDGICLLPALHAMLKQLGADLGVPFD